MIVIGNERNKDRNFYVNDEFLLNTITINLLKYLMFSTLSLPFILSSISEKWTREKKHFPFVEFLTTWNGII